MQAVVLAAGRGTRLGSLTARRSKAMLPVVGQPLVGRALERLRAAGLRRFIVVGGPDDRELADYCDDAAGQISYVVQAERRGTAHALACAAPLLNGPFLLLACDNLIPSDFIATMLDYWRDTQVDGVLTLLHMSPQRLQHSAVVEMTADGRVQTIVEKPPPGSTESDAGSIFLYAFRLPLLNLLDVPLSPRGEQELQSALQTWIDAGGDLRGLFAPERRTVTRPADLMALNLHYLDREIGTEVQAALPPDVEIRPPVRVEAGVEVAAGAGSVVGPRVYLEEGCRVGKGVRLRDVMVMRGSAVPDGAEVINAIWSGDGAVRPA